MRVTKNLKLFLLFNLHFNDAFSLFFISNESNKNLIDNQQIVKFDSFRIEKIHEFLYEICKNNPDNHHRIFPRVLVELIRGYEGTIFIDIDYYYVMSKLDPLEEWSRYLNPGNENFLHNFNALIERKMNEFSRFNIFWADLGGIFLKAIFDLRRKMIGAPSSEFKKTTKIILFINSIIKGKFSQVIYEFSFKNLRDFDFEIMNVWDFNHEFLNIVYFENSDRLANTFIAALEHVYSPPSTINEKEMRIKKWKIPKFNCKEFKEKFFENGNPNTDTLLKFFMVRYDKGGIVLKCLESNFSSIHSTVTKKLIKEIKANIDGLRSKGIGHFSNIITLNYMTSLEMSFTWSDKRKFKIENERELFWLLKAMKETELLNKENVKAMIGLKENNNKWNQNTFEKYLRRYGGELSKVTSDFDFINECLKLFELKPFKDALDQLFENLCLIS